MHVDTEGSWQYTYTVADETIRYRWRVLRTPVTSPTGTSATLVSASPDSGSVLAEGTALTQEAAAARAIQELTRIVAKARRST